MATNRHRLTWKEVITKLVAEAHESPGTIVRVAIPDIEHPLLAGMEPALLEQAGQRMDYQKLFGKGRLGCHIREFCDYYDVWLYAVAPSSLPVLVDPPQHAVAVRKPAALSLVDLPREAPGAVFLATTLLGTVIGALAGGAKGAAAGALVGGGAGLAAVAVSNANSSPEIAHAAHSMFQGLATTALARQSAARVALPAPVRFALPAQIESPQPTQSKATRRPTSKR